MSYTHTFAVINCQHCRADLTQADSVIIEARDNAGSDLGQHKTRLASNGELLDTGGLIAAGFHAGTECSNCGHRLDDYEN